MGFDFDEVRSNLTEDVKLRLDDDGLVGQLMYVFFRFGCFLRLYPIISADAYSFLFFSSLTIAAHDTTSTTLSWLFYQLSRHPDFQDQMRAEIMRFRAEVGDKELTPSDYESLPLTTAAIKYVHE